MLIVIGSMSPWVLPERTLGTVRYTEILWPSVGDNRGSARLRGYPALFTMRLANTPFQVVSIPTGPTGLHALREHEFICPLSRPDNSSELTSVHNTSQTCHQMSLSVYRGQSRI